MAFLVVAMLVAVGLPSAVAGVRPTLASTSASATGAGDQLWARRYNGPGNGQDGAAALGVSPDGSRVFVTGRSEGGSSLSDYATVAYDAASGAKIWSKRYDGPAGSSDEAKALGVSPDGTKLFVTGRSFDPSSGYDYATVAYDAATGARLWAKRYDGQSSQDDSATAIAVSPDGSRVFVTGSSEGVSQDYATVAYDAASGAKLWARRYNGPADGDDSGHAVGVSPDGSTVFVTGSSDFGSSSYDVLTFALNARTGAERWATRYNAPWNLSDGGNALGVSADGSRLYVAGWDTTTSTGMDYFTLAFDAASGETLWGRPYNGPVSAADVAVALVVSPDGSKVSVTGESDGGSAGTDYATVTYDASGSLLWAKRYDGLASLDDRADAIAAAPDGSKVFVTGSANQGSSGADYTTVAYDASSGAKLWVKRYDGPANGADQAVALGVGPDGSSLFVTGSSDGGPTSADYVTVAYSAG